MKVSARAVCATDTGSKCPPRTGRSRSAVPAPPHAPDAGSAKNIASPRLWRRSPWRPPPHRSVPTARGSAARRGHGQRPHGPAGSRPASDRSTASSASHRRNDASKRESRMFRAGTPGAEQQRRHAQQPFAHRRGIAHGRARARPHAHRAHARDLLQHLQQPARERGQCQRRDRGQPSAIASGTNSQGAAMNATFSKLGLTEATKKRPSAIEHPGLQCSPARERDVREDQRREL